MKRILTYSFLLTIATALLGQGVRIEKSYTDSFLVGTDEKVEISNKYGEIVVNTWYNDSVRIDVRVTANSKSQEAANKDINKVDVKLRRLGNTILGETTFIQAKKSFFGDLMNQVGDASKSIVGGSNTTIDYQVWMPADLSLVLTNKYGDIYLSTMEGNVSIDLSHGNLRAEKLPGVLSFKHSFGKHNIDYVKDGNLSLRGVEGKINEVAKLSIESSSSEMKFTKVDQLQMNSRNDKYDISHINRLLGEGSFTDLVVDDLTDQARLDFSYGDIYLTKIDKDFNQINLKGNSCDINMILNQASYIQSKIIGASERMILPNSMLGMSRSTLDDGRIQLEGHVGNTNTQVGNLDVNIDAGNLVISIQETDMFTNRD